MTIISCKIDKYIKDKNITLYGFAKSLNFSEGALYDMYQNRRPFSDAAIESLLPILEVSQEEFDSWIIADKYPRKLIKQAFGVKKSTKIKKKQLIFTVKIDAILEEKGISRTTLSKQIKYDQSAVNKIITGKKSISKPVLERMAKALDVPQDDLSSWFLADKYSLKTFELALSL